MKLKHIFLSCVSAALLASCSEYDDPADRFTEVPDVTPVSRVLLAEFTGQLCSNCPTAHEKIEDYERLFGDFFICVSIHGDNTMMGLPVNNPMGLGTEQGVKYNELFNVELWPNAVVNWKSGAIGSDYGKWVSKLVEGMIRPTDIDLSATASMPTDSTITVDVRIRSDKAQPGTRFNIWLSEDNIIGMQLMPNGAPDPKYVHNGVFRKALCGIEGEDVAIIANVEASESRSTVIDPKWNPENMNAVVFVYTESQGVTNVIKTKVRTAAAKPE